VIPEKKKNYSKNPIPKITKAKRAEGMAKVVECLQLKVRKKRKGLSERGGISISTSLFFFDHTGF
jgi:hypothetical protein